MFSLLALSLRSNRDVLSARQRLRRLAGLLQYDEEEQALIAAATFAVADQALQVYGRARLSIQVVGHDLHVFAVPLDESGAFDETRRRPKRCTLMRLVRALPARRELSTDDLGWIASQAFRLASPNLFAEVRRQNEEILGLLHAMQEGRRANSAA